MTLERGLGGADVVRISFPGEKNWLRKGTTKSKTDWPRIRSVLANGGEVSGGGLRILPTTEKENTA